MRKASKRVGLAAVLGSVFVVLVILVFVPRGADDTLQPSASDIWRNVAFLVLLGSAVGVFVYVLARPARQQRRKSVRGDELHRDR
ncbi:hypothetical protein [Xylanimonas sp. McL0601]|uniref:hypothetical protein n=1 Tax=Xylanimonas sp. McL0601 TaxID=3414739 RepID=UPI003CF9523E